MEKNLIKQWVKKMELLVFIREKGLPVTGIAETESPKVIIPWEGIVLKISLEELKRQRKKLKPEQQIFV